MGASELVSKVTGELARSHGPPAHQDGRSTAAGKRLSGTVDLIVKVKIVRPHRVLSGERVPAGRVRVRGRRSPR